MKDSAELIKSQLNLIEKMAINQNSTLFKELDKLIPDSPIKIGVDYYKGYALDQYGCPSCERPIGDEIMVFSYCPNCGKKIGKL